MCQLSDLVFMSRSHKQREALGLDIKPEKMKTALDPFMLATDIADYLVHKGVPFRETHHISDRVVALSEKIDTPMNELMYDQLKSIDARFEKDIADSF
ncbi:argininosuccinate lyase C-terminal-domain-containing protein [Hypoxylon rubiginosum]|uniref:Argininosuccinate lyase C-terminal-domain-containing protein n=1 Tax=Hypoxylon rubiginosum TaxID=110542 RepID=A0ACB9ZGV9_9PEZI|nr:argininosuccinate lyase C-terminal-domain-containing protein [Hypoxylon rubiginosum]